MRALVRTGVHRNTCREDSGKTLHVHRYLEYKDIRIGQTNVDLPEAAGVSEPITPQQCRLRDMTYSAQVRSAGSHPVCCYEVM
jgi:DNA-directed RNA polymerase beta subunit